jgi:hypothetical protein
MMTVRTLYVRNVPDDVASGLEELATRAGMSLNAFVVRELAETAARARNRALLADLSDLGIGMEEVVASIEEGRRER